MNDFIKTEKNNVKDDVCKLDPLQDLKNEYAKSFNETNRGFGDTFKKNSKSIFLSQLNTRNSVNNSLKDEMSNKNAYNLHESSNVLRPLW